MTEIKGLENLRDLTSLNLDRNHITKIKGLDNLTKLTGLKTDENEDPWGNGIFKNPWVTCDELQEAFRLICNQILTHITSLTSYNLDQLLLTSTLSRMAIPSPGYNVFFLLGILSVILINSKKKVMKSLRFD